MRACIYARTCRKDKSHNRTSIDRQIEYSRELARKHNLLVESRHVFTDLDHEGSSPPTCWSGDDDDACRPALSALIDTLVNGVVTRVIVHRIERLGTTSELLLSLGELFGEHSVRVIVPPDEITNNEDPGAKFALSLLRPFIQFDTEPDRDRKEKLRAKKIEEINRIKEKLSRLEEEVSQLQ